MAVIYLINSLCHLGQDYLKRTPCLSEARRILNEPFILSWSWSSESLVTDLFRRNKGILCRIKGWWVWKLVPKKFHNYCTLPRGQRCQRARKATPWWGEVPRSYSAEAELENGSQSTESWQEAPGSGGDSFRAGEWSSASGVRCVKRRLGRLLYVSVAALIT